MMRLNMSLLSAADLPGCLESAGASQRGDRDASSSRDTKRRPRRGTRQGSDIDDIGS